MRRLDQEQLLVSPKNPTVSVRKSRRRRMVGIEDCDEFALAVREAVVEVAGLGVLVVLAGQITDAELDAERLQACGACSAWAAFSGSSAATFSSVPPSSSRNTLSLSLG